MWRFPAPEKGDFSKNIGILQLNVKLSITHKYLNHHRIPDRIICPCKEIISSPGTFREVHLHLAGLSPRF
jgi:hypothetical protein